MHFLVWKISKAIMRPPRVPPAQYYGSITTVYWLSSRIGKQSGRWQTLNQTTDNWPFTAPTVENRTILMEVQCTKRSAGWVHIFKKKALFYILPRKSRNKYILLLPWGLHYLCRNKWRHFKMCWWGAACMSTLSGSM